AFGYWTKRHFDARLAGVLPAARPAPTHHDSLGPGQFEIDAAALMFAAVQLAEADTVASAQAQIDIGLKHRPRVGTPPLPDGFRRGQGIEDDLRPRLDPAYQSQAYRSILFHTTTVDPVAPA